MTQPISNIKLTFAGQAVKYMQNGSLKEKSLFDEVKSSAVGSLPFAVAFAAVPTLWGAGKIARKDGKTFMEALRIKTDAKAASTAVQEHGRVAKFFKLDKLSDCYSKTKFANTKVGGLFKGASTMFLMTGLFELMEVIPAFKNGGVGAGLKQTAKSAGNVVVDGLMYSAGLKLGTMAGAKLGAMLGTAGGPIGALVGGVAGMVLGGALNTLGRGLLDKVMGKNFSVKKQEQDMQTQAQAIAQDDAALAQMKDAVQAQIIAKAQSGKELTKDDEQMLALAQAVEVDNSQAQTSAQALASEQGAQGTIQTNDMQAAQVQNTMQVDNIQAAQAQNVTMTPEEQEEAELIARLQKVDNPQIDYQVPDNFSISA
ncbi:hypothetical protein IKA15_00705 [bacterium]|nr:hypothetical protein [bacterium]